MFNLSFDHYTIKVENLEKSATFYKKILGLQEIKNRTQKPHIRWFSLGNGQEFHIVKGDTEQIQTNIGVHMAMRLNDFEGFLSHLQTNDISLHNSKGKSGEITTRADGVRQVYFQDPDHYWIEVNDAEL